MTCTEIKIIDQVKIGHGSNNKHISKLAPKGMITILTKNLEA